MFSLRFRLVFKKILLLFALIAILLHSSRIISFAESHTNLNFHQQLIQASEAVQSILITTPNNANDLWWLNKDFNVPVNISLPHSKPLLYPFDPRFTINSYLNYIYNEFKSTKSDFNDEFNSTDAYPSLPFHWSDWIDLKILHEHILYGKKPENYCKTLFSIPKFTSLKELEKFCKISNKTPLGFEIMNYGVSQSRDRLKLIGRAYLYTSAPPPSKLVFLTNSNVDSSYIFNVVNDENDLKYGLLNNGMIDSDKYTNNMLDTYSSLTKEFSPPVNNPLIDVINLTSSSFDVNIQEILQNEPKVKSKTDESYYNSIKCSIAIEKPEKYFTETLINLKDRSRSLGAHYDWRFFNGITIGTKEHVSTLHRLIKNYLNFARQNNINTWVAHGSLLSWYWSGKSFPWDSDVDVQVPIADLHYLAKNFNQSLIIENVVDNDGKFDGLGRYFLDIGTFITHRSRGNGNNNIDARFIDIDTGAYIDITALSVSDTHAPKRYRDSNIPIYDDTSLTNLEKNRILNVYNCRNNHFSQLEDLTPLNPSIVENQISYIPSNFTKPLEVEYKPKSLNNHRYLKYTFLNEIGVWAESKFITDYGHDPKKWIKKKNITTSQNGSILDRGCFKFPNSITNANKFLKEFSSTDYDNLLYEPTLMKNYHPQLIQYHQDELKDLLQGRHNQTQLIDYVNKKSNRVGSGLKPDNFMSEIIKSGNTNFNEKAQKLLKLYGNN